MKLHNPFDSDNLFVELASKSLVFLVFIVMIIALPEITFSLLIAGVVGRVVYYVIKGK